MKKLKDLNLIDNFLFNELMLQEDQEKAKEFARSILKPIIKKKIGNIEIEGQKLIQGMDVDKRGIQLDAYVKFYDDDSGEKAADISIKPKPIIYDIEPNTIAQADEKIARTYHSIIDSNSIKSGTKFKNIPDVYVIFILPYDPFNLNRMVYTIQNRCIEEPDMPYHDGATTIFLYAHGTKDIPSQELANMLKYFVETTKENAENANMNNVMEMVSNIKDNSEIEVKYMQSWEEKEYYMDLGIKQGLSQGKSEYIIKLLQRFDIQDNSLFETILKETDIDTLNRWFDLAMKASSLEDFKAGL